MKTKVLMFVMVAMAAGFCTPAPAQTHVRQTTTVTVCTGPDAWMCSYSRPLDKNGRRIPIDCGDSLSAQRSIACQADKQQIELTHKSVI